MRAAGRPMLWATIAVGLGFLAVVAATVVGWNGALLDAVVRVTEWRTPTADVHRRVALIA